MTSPTQDTPRILEMMFGRLFFRDKYVLKFKERQPEASGFTDCWLLYQSPEAAWHPLRARYADGRLAQITYKRPATAVPTAIQERVEGLLSALEAGHKEQGEVRFEVNRVETLSLLFQKRQTEGLLPYIAYKDFWEVFAEQTGAVANFEVVKPSSEGSAHFVNLCEVEPTVQGLGITPQVYKAFAKIYHGIMSDMTFTTDKPIKIWRALGAQELPEKTVTGQPRFFLQEPLEIQQSLLG